MIQLVFRAPNKGVLFQDKLARSLHLAGPGLISATEQDHGPIAPNAMRVSSPAGSLTIKNSAIQKHHRRL